MRRLAPPMSGIGMVVLLMMAWMVGCVVAGDGSLALRLHQVTWVGTHRSFHATPEAPTVPVWNHSEPLLAVQLSSHGVRHFEFSVVRAGATFEVVLAPPFDTGSSCGTLSECLGVLRVWSDAQSPAAPCLVVAVVPLDAAGYGSGDWAALDAVLDAAWPDAPRQASPAWLLGQSGRDSLREMALGHAWPTLFSAAGRALFLVAAPVPSHALGYLARDGGAAAAMALVVGGDTLRDHPDIAVLAFDDPESDGRAIGLAVLSGMLVRTRADAALVAANLTDAAVARAYAAAADRAPADGVVTAAELTALLEAAQPGRAPNATAVGEALARCGDTGAGVGVPGIACLQSDPAHLVPLAAAATATAAEAQRRAALALSSGAHFVVSSYARPGDAASGGYGMTAQMEDGTVLCNAVTAAFEPPVVCTAARATHQARGGCDDDNCHACIEANVCVMCADRWALDADTHACAQCPAGAQWVSSDVPCTELVVGPASLPSLSQFQRATVWTAAVIACLLCAAATLCLWDTRRSARKRYKQQMAHSSDYYSDDESDPSSYDVVVMGEQRFRSFRDAPPLPSSAGSSLASTSSF